MAEETADNSPREDRRVVSQPRSRGLVGLLFRSKGPLVFAVFATLISGGATAAVIGVINNIIADPDTVWESTNLFVALCVGALATGYVASLVLIRQLEHGAHQLRMLLQKRAVAFPVRRIEEAGLEKMGAVLTSDVQTVSNFGPSLTIVFASTAIVLLCVAYMFWLSWKLALWALPVAVVLFLLRLAASRADRFIRKARQAQQEMYGHLRTLVDGAKELKMHHVRRDVWIAEGVKDSSIRFRKNAMKAHVVYLVIDNLLRLLSFILIGVLLLVAVKYFPRAVVIGFALTLLYVMGPIRQLANQMRSIANARESLWRIERLNFLVKDQNERLITDFLKRPTHDACESIELRGLHYTYQSEDETFEVGPIDLEISPGELLFIVGGNGSGKSTLAKLLTGIYVPDEGEIVFNGKTIDEDNLDWYRQHISAVFSDFHLFDDLRIGEESDERAKALLEKLALSHKVRIESGKLSTTSLSAGQRRRLALLSAVIEDRPICMFDEWAADQDPTFKRFFYEELLPELRDQGKAVVVITHDDRYFSAADRVIKLEDGKIVADDAA